MNFTDFKARADDDGKRLDRVLKKILGDGGMSVHALLRKKLIRVNGEKAEHSMRLSDGDTVQIASFLLEGRSAHEDGAEIPGGGDGRTGSVPGTAGFDTVFRNGHLWVINKKSGMRVQEDIAPLVRDLSPKENRSLSFTPAPLHRTDRLTSGLLVCSQSARGAEWFSHLLRENSRARTDGYEADVPSGGIRKFYLAVAEGSISGSLTLENLIQTDDAPRGGFSTVRVFPASDRNSCGKPARTVIVPLAHGSCGGKELTLIQAQILSGRKHQIRAQCAYHGTPLFGDSAYGSSAGTGGKFLLHASCMTFPENNLGIPERLTAPLPADFLRALISFGIPPETARLSPC